MQHSTDSLTCFRSIATATTTASEKKCTQNEERMIACPSIRWRQSQSPSHLLTVTATASASDVNKQNASLSVGWLLLIIWSVDRGISYFGYPRNQVPPFDPRTLDHVTFPLSGSSGARRGDRQYRMSPYFHHWHGPIISEKPFGPLDPVVNLRGSGRCDDGNGGWWYPSPRLAGSTQKIFLAQPAPGPSAHRQNISAQRISHTLSTAFVPHLQGEFLASLLHLPVGRCWPRTLRSP